MNLTDGLTEHLQDVTPPPPDLDRVVDRGRRLRRARLTVQVAVTALVVGAIGGGALMIRGDDGGSSVTVPPIAVGPMDLSHGLRAHGDPGGQVRMGNRSFPAKDMEWLDTDAAATDEGIVFFQDGRPFLLDRTGKPRVLWTAPVDDPKGWHPTAKNDAAEPSVAFAGRTRSATG